jgi:hypothetical protein
MENRKRRRSNQLWHLYEDERRAIPYVAFAMALGFAIVCAILAHEFY